MRHRSGARGREAILGLVQATGMRRVATAEPAEGPGEGSFRRLKCSFQKAAGPPSCPRAEARRTVAALSWLT